MTEKRKKFLADISHAILLIEKFTSETHSFVDYSKDLKTQSAVERQLVIIGEAVNKYNQLSPKETLNNTRKIVGFRNR
jgi:uncharacterized protein with HEPN domain